MVRHSTKKIKHFQVFNLSIMNKPKFWSFDPDNFPSHFSQYFLWLSINKTLKPFKNRSIGWRTGTTKIALSRAVHQTASKVFTSGLKGAPPSSHPNCTPVNYRSWLVDETRAARTFLPPLAWLLLITLTCLARAKVPSATWPP